MNWRIYKMEWIAIAAFMIVGATFVYIAYEVNNHKTAHK